MSAEETLAAIAAEVGLSPDDHAGIVRAVKARDGAGGELVEIAVLVGLTSRHRARGEVLGAVRAFIAGQRSTQ